MRKFLKRHAWKAVGKRIRDRREVLGLSQRELAEKAAVRQGTVSEWELGQVEMRLLHLVKVAVVLGVDPLWLLMGDREGD